MANLCNLDGAIGPEADARIPVLDRGFLFGDSVYEVCRTRGGVPFAWPEHLERLRTSAEGLLLPLDLDDRTVMQRVQKTLQAAANAESYVRIIVSRGTGTAPNIDLQYAPGPCRWVILVRPLTTLPGQPVHLALVPRLRNDRRALDPAVKSGNYLNNVLGLAEAKARGATDAVFLNHAGHVTEASTSNVFAVRAGRVHTPPLHAGILAGITRTLVLEVCRERGLEVIENDLTAEALRGADELFVSSTLRDIAPVTHLDGAPVQNGGVGPLTLALMEAFAAYCERLSATRYGPELARLLRGSEQ